MKNLCVLRALRGEKMELMNTNIHKIIRVFPRRTKWTPTDDLAFIGEPPLFELPNLPVCVSVTFTWDIDEADRISTAWQKRVSDNVSLGGPALENLPAISYATRKSISFIPGRFIKEGVTFTSRGCPKNCPWCLVSRREGSLREINIAPGHIVQDNNLLACSQGHIERVFEMLRQQKKGIVFSGGLDIDYLQPWHIDLLKTIKVSELWVACDCEKDLKRLNKAADLLADFPEEKKRCYVMIGFGDERVTEAERRLEAVYAKGFLPFAQLYRGPHDESWGTCWKNLQRKWSRPAAYRGKSAISREGRPTVENHKP